MARQPVRRSFPAALLHRAWASDGGPRIRQDLTVAVDFTPGYPVDLRSAERRVLMAQGPTGDFEFMAARVIARLTGERVIIQDDGTKSAMPDIRIDYADRPAAYAEVVVDIDSSYAAVAARIWDANNPLPAVMTWKVHLTGQANLKRLRRKLPELPGTLQTPPEPHVEQDLARMGATVLGPWPTGPNRPGGIHLAPEGIAGSVVLMWEPLNAWIKTYLASDRTADVRRKLAATGAAERHAFIGMSFTSPGDAYFALRREARPHLPPGNPTLPPEVRTYGYGQCKLIIDAWHGLPKEAGSMSKITGPRPDPLLAKAVSGTIVISRAAAHRPCSSVRD
jgi:hypothetical protein